MDSLFVEDLVFLANTKSFFINLFVNAKYKRRAQHQIDSEDEGSVRVTEEMVVNESIKFYSIRMLILHFKYLQIASEAAATGPQSESLRRSYGVRKLLDRFRETHPFDSLEEFLRHHSETPASVHQNQEPGRERLEATYRSARKHVVLTYTKCDMLTYSKKIKCREIHVSRVNEKGTVYLESQLDDFHADASQSFFVLIFKSDRDMAHFKYLKHCIDNFKPSPGSAAKHIVLIVHKDIDFADASRNREVNWEIDSTRIGSEEPWQFVVIENLHDSHYR